MYPAGTVKDSRICFVGYGFFYPTIADIKVISPGVGNVPVFLSNILIF